MKTRKSSINTKKWIFSLKRLFFLLLLLHLSCFTAYQNHHNQCTKGLQKELEHVGKNFSLQEMRTFSTLDLSRTDITDSSLVFISELQNLTNLDLSYTLITDISLEYVGKLTKLTYLNLSNIEVTERGLTFLKNLQHLKKLDLSKTPLTDKVLELVKNFSNLNHLKLGNEQMHALGRGSRCIYYGWDASYEVEDFASVFAKTPKIFVAEITNKGLEHLQNLKKLSILDLSGIKVDDSGIIFLKNLVHLKELNLIRTLLTEEGIKNLRQSLPKCKITHHTDPLMLLKEDE